MIKLAYLLTHPIQYQSPLLRRIAEEEDIELTVFYCSELSAGQFFDTEMNAQVTWDTPLLDGYNFEFLPALTDRKKLSTLLPINVGFKRRLQTGKFDALWVHGYGRPFHLAAIGAAKSLGLRVLLRDEANLVSGTNDGVKGAIKSGVMNFLARRVDAFLAIGSLNRDYWKFWGIPDEKIFSMPYAVDNEYFRSKSAAAQMGRTQLLAELGLPSGPPVVLFAGKLSPRKRPMDLLEAFLRVGGDSNAAPEASLIFVGEGEQRAELEQRAKLSGWANIRFTGFKNQSELPAFYAASDIFVLPSEHETWGLVVNEAMNAGCAVIASDRVGSSADLVRPGKNGAIFAVGDVAGLSKALSACLRDREYLESLGNTSRDLVAGWGFEQDVAGLRAALDLG